MRHNGSNRQLTLATAGGPLIATKDDGLDSESSLVGAALALGAREISGWSDAEERLARWAPHRVPCDLDEIRRTILAGGDPLGEAFCRIRTPVERRNSGATFTPQAIVDAMAGWAADYGTPAKVIDPGTGSGRFLLAAGRRIPNAHLLGVEIDPLPAMLARANLAACGFAGRSEVVLGDYRSVPIPPSSGKTLYIGNPPYVRHHQVGGDWKLWLVREARRQGHAASQLAGMHVHFFLATLARAAEGDYGTFITAAEWLDVNYGRLVREMFLGKLGGSEILLIEPAAMPFPDAAATAAITYFHIGTKPKQVRFKRIASLDELAAENGNRTVPRERLATASRWSPLTRRPRKAPAGFVELGELCRVHRGQVTGANKVWIAGPHSLGLPESVLFPAVTKARELFEAGSVLEDSSRLRRVIDLPPDLDALDASDRRAVEKFLAKARSLGAHAGYIARNRKAWWSVALHAPAPILTTYMARRPPAFVLNLAGARHLNIAHGVYPRQALSRPVLENLAEYLRKTVRVTEGRTYAGGLTKFEPREVERLLVPGLEVLQQGTPEDA